MQRINWASNLIRLLELPPASLALQLAPNVGGAAFPFGLRRQSGAATALSSGRGVPEFRKHPARAKAVSRCACHRSPKGRKRKGTKSSLDATQILRQAIAHEVHFHPHWESQALRPCGAGKVGRAGHDHHSWTTRGGTESRARALDSVASGEARRSSALR